MAVLDQSLIAGLDALRGLAPGDLSEVLKPARLSRQARGSHVFEQDEDAHSFFLLLDGYIRVVRTTAEGHRVIVRHIGEGEVFGIAAANGRNTYTASAVCIVDCAVLVWPMAVWPDLSARFPDFEANAYRGSHQQKTHVVDMSSELVEQRVAHAILRLMDRTGRETADGIEVETPISRQDIAEMTGTTFHSVNCLLSAWEEEQVVKSGRRRLTVTDPHRLLLFAEGRAARQAR